MKRPNLFFFLLTLVFIWSIINPKDYFTWVLEALPLLLAVPILIRLKPKFRFTDLAYTLIAIHGMILLVGAHYTYAEVPLFHYIREAFGLSRNHYDRVGHLAQGFIPAIVAREVFIRKQVTRGSGWTFFLVCCLCLAVSAFYELIEWWVAIGTGEKAEAFLGTQGDVWDTQTDMMLALVGSILAQLLLGKIHDREINEISPRQGYDTSSQSNKISAA